MENYMKLYREVFRGGYIRDESIRNHIKQQAIIDELLPESPSFFYVVETSTHKYHFIGKHQVNISGYSNEEFIKKGVELFLQSLHPEEVEIILNNVYPEYSDFIAGMPPEDRSKIKFQYNYRFRRKNGKEVNLIEQGYVLEVERMGGLH